MNSEIVLQLDPTPQNGRNSEGSFVELQDGTLVFAWTQYISDSPHDHAPARLVYKRSWDQGSTWEDQTHVLVEKGDALNLMSVSLLRLQDGRILLSYLSKHALEHGIYTCTPMVCFSSDELKSFSSAKPLTVVPGYYGMNNDRIIQLQCGRLVAPLALHRFRIPSEAIPDWPNAPILSNPATMTYMVSDDGEVWYESLTNVYRCFSNGRGFQEPGVIELKDGSIWSWFRTGWEGEDGGDGRQWQSFSVDGGHVWSEAEPSQFRSPCSPLCMKRIPATGDLLTVWNDHSGQITTPPFVQGSKGRTPLVVGISQDEGRSFENRHLLEDAPDHGFCYTAIHFTEDSVLLAYCAGGAPLRGVLTRLRMRKVALASLYSLS